MSVAELPKEQAVAKAIREISHIATLPEVTLRIIQLVESSTSTAQDLHKVISTDPALSARILKVVNSAFYGLPGQIGSINRAIVLLGLNAVKNIAIAASLAKLFRGGVLTPTFSARDLWDHSLAVGTASKMIADSLKVGFADEAFLAGLIHDLGVIVECQYDRNRLIEVVMRTGCDASGAPQSDMLAHEAQVFGATHQDFGQALCAKWKFPRSFQNATGSHHNPLAVSPDSRSLVSIVAIADRLACERARGFRLDARDTSIPTDFLDAARLSGAALQDITQRLAETIGSVQTVLTAA